MRYWDASRYARLHFSAMAITARDRLLFGPHCHCGCDCGCSLLNQPFVLTFWNNSEATRFCVLPSGTKTIRIKLPRAGVHAARLCKRLTGHRAARRKRHFEFGTAEAVKGWPLKKVAWMSFGAIGSAAKAALVVRSTHMTVNGPARINSLPFRCVMWPITARA
jgi:hypothetical protein